jgi:deoxyribonuclease-1-like protein
VWKPLSVALICAAAGGMYYILDRYEVAREDGRIVITPRDPAPPSAPSGLPVTDPSRTTIRLATFNLGRLDRNKLSSPLVAAHLATLIRDFDVVAVQGICAPNQGLIRELVRSVNAAGGNYDFAVAPEVGTETIASYSGFLFDAGRIDIDRSKVQTVEDPAGRFIHPPVIGMFRARGPAANEAFTFMLVNVQVDPQRADMELDLLDDVYYAAQDSQPAEDDVIMLGDFEAPPEKCGQLARIPNIAWAVSGTVSTTRGTGLVDNIFYSRRATTELTGRGGVVDLIRRLNLNIDEAATVAEHMPIWVELSVFEGGQAGRIAADAAARR